MAGVDATTKRTRESTSKVRTGCITCKARRVKCDEAKPVCRRCSVGSRQCEYSSPEAKPPSSRNVVTIYLPPTQNQPTVLVHDLGLDFFHRNLAAKLDGQFDSQFWSKLVLQLSQSEPSVRHAVSAISVIHQDVESSLRHPRGYIDANPAAQKEWSKSMKTLSTRIETQPHSNLVPLVCCLLFTCMEFLRGGVRNAMLHIDNGFKILDAVRQNSTGLPNSAGSVSQEDLKAIEEHIVPVFTRLKVLCLLAGSILPPIDIHSIEIDGPHQDLVDSRQRLYRLTDTCLRFLGQARLKASNFEVQVDDFVEQAKLQSRLDTWRNELDQLVERLRRAGKPCKQEAVHLLVVHFKSIYIWLRVSTIAEENATDAYFADFEELVESAEQVVKPDVSIAETQPLSFDIQIVGPLYYVVLKCRHPVLRRRALRLLQWAPRREGLWNAHHAYMTAKRIIELEESNLNPQGLPDELGRVHDLPLPGEEDRIYGPGERPFDFRQFDAGIVPSPTCPGTLEAVFRAKPSGILGEWQTITEHIKL